MKRLFDGGKDSSMVSTFARSIDVELTKAWNEGADDMGVAPDEMSKDDMKVLNAIISNENDFILKMVYDINTAHDDGMDKEQFDRQFGARCDLWANRYNETVNRARMNFGQKARLVWTLGKTEEHCETCAKLNGIVAFGYEWDEARFMPQMPPNKNLDCGGWNCDCSLKPTAKRRTDRAFSILTNIAVSRGL
jgi:hypothetical protein